MRSHTSVGRGYICLVVVLCPGWTSCLFKLIDVDGWIAASVLVCLHFYVFHAYFFVRLHDRLLLHRKLMLVRVILLLLAQNVLSQTETFSCQLLGQIGTDLQVLNSRGVHF